MQDYGAKKRGLAKERSKAERKKSMRTGSVTGLLIFVRSLLNSSRLRTASENSGAQSPATDMDRLVLALSTLAPKG